MNKLTGVAFLLAVFSLAGCSASTGDPQGASSGSSMSQEQSAALADGVVTAEEYEGGYRRYVACMEEAGYQIVEQPKDGVVIKYAVPENAVTSGADEACYQTEFFQLDMEWQVSNEDSSETARIVAACLEDRGIEPEVTVEDMLGQLESAGLTLEQCL